MNCDIGNFDFVTSSKEYRLPSSLIILSQLDNFQLGQFRDNMMRHVFFNYLQGSMTNIFTAWQRQGAHLRLATTKDTASQMGLGSALWTDRHKTEPFNEVPFPHHFSRPSSIAHYTPDLLIPHAPDRAGAPDKGSMSGSRQHLGSWTRQSLHLRLLDVHGRKPSG